MRLEEQYILLQNLKTEINDKLVNLDFHKIKELVLWLAKSADYQKLKSKDDELLVLDFFVAVWLQEKRNMDDFSMQGDIFWSVSSLRDAEEKYNMVKFALFRLENDFAYEHCISLVQQICRMKVSAYAISMIVEREISKKEYVTIKMADILKQQNELVKAIGLLNVGSKKYSENEEMKLNLVECWLCAQQLEAAYKCICEFENSTPRIDEIKYELEKVLNDENL